jgi:hypothetical protein
MSDERQSPSSLAHPAPARARVSWLIVVIGLFVAPAAWLAQLNASVVLGSKQCGGEPAGWHLAIVAVGVAAAVLALAALASAASAWSRTRAEGPGDHHAALTSGHGRTRFLALSGIIFSCMFLIAVIFALFVPWMVSTCSA